MGKRAVTSSLGYPRIGEHREWKKALEQYWSNRLTEAEFTAELKRIRLAHLQKQQELGIDWIPVNDSSYYDQMLDMSAMFGIVPQRYHYSGGPVSLETYYAMARGTKDAPACEMTKWFNTNYHYIVPELNDIEPKLTENRPLNAYREAKKLLNIDGKPVLIGPFTFVKLSKGYEAENFADVVKKFIPLYIEIFQELAQEGVQWVQVDEPAFVLDLTKQDEQIATAAYHEICRAVPGLNIMLQTYFEAVEPYEWLISLPVQGIGLDFVHDRGEHVAALNKFSFPHDKVLGAGIIDGRNIWRADLEQKIALIDQLSSIVDLERIVLQPSCSLLHVPVTVEHEQSLPKELQLSLAFADEKLKELKLLSERCERGKVEASAQWAAHQQALRELQTLRLASTASEEGTPLSYERSLPYAERKKLQQEKWQLPLLPTTTIGSLPQTPEIRKARQSYRKNEWSQKQYETFIQAKIAEWIQKQEEIGLDVLVHGEFERNDMVEYFGEKLDGFAFTANGWVQSYGSRCVKPPIIYKDVQFIEPMTLSESAYASTLTSKPVKGMLTGPITIYNWSFARDDRSASDVMQQIAIALRKEIAVLESAGIEMIQVDEPALKEGMPLKGKDQNDYLESSVQAFQLSTAGVQDTTQIHTHMCYSDFNDMIASIRALDADVISIETSRSHGELVESFETNHYELGIGLGVYDIHSPRIPSVEEMRSMIDRALQVLEPEQFWINPDCGLKTRGEEETIAALKNMVQAAQKVRGEILTGESIS